jgi:DNA polymerase elongation subunit (family B)
MSNYTQTEIKNILTKYVEYLQEGPIQYCVSGLDYSSLYPSLIMAYNLSPEYLIVDQDYQKELANKGYNIHNINFEYNYKDYLGNEKTKDIIAWTVRHDETNKENTRFGLYPSILRDLFKQRAEMKKELAIYKDKKEHIEKYETDYLDNKEYKECIFKLNYCDTKQKALKVFMNTFYGVMGNKTSALFQLPLAGGVTSAGQYNLLLVKKYVESLDHKVYYGDSVTGDTPIIIRRNNIISIIPINELNWNNKKYENYNNDKEIIIDNKTEVYTEKGWTIIKKCIRHYTNKKLYRISTQSGIVIVTEDHSLLNENSEKIKPEECKIGTNLLHWKNIDLECLETKYNINELINKPSIYCSNQLETQKIYLFLLKYNYRCNIENILNNNYKITIIKKIQNTIDPSITKIEFVGYSNDYVYDLETDSHHFSAGIGQLVVHNTDSLYISCPKEYYLETDKQYYTNQISKTEYNTQLVLITFKAIEDIKVKVNEYLYQNNGTRYLKMSYEEVLYPLAFLSKKKYFGIPHETLPNFKPKDLFIRGLEVKKRGVSELLRIICSDLMWKSMDLENTKSLRELVEDKIKEIFNTKWNLEDFIQTGVWKPDKQNQTLNKFVERMREENKELPVPRERFSYVIVKKYPYKYDYKGRQIPLQKSDKMEYLDIVKKYNYEIDLKYYFDNQLTGQFARLITYDPEFEIIINNDIDEDKTYNQCQKYVLKLADQYNNNYKDRNKIFKKVYKEINNKYKEITTTKKIYDKKYNFLLNTKYKIKEIDNNNIYEILNYNIEEYIKTINHEIENISKNLLNKYKNNKVIIQKLYNTDSKSYYIVQISSLTNKLNNLIQKILNLITQYNLSEYIFNIDNMNIINLVNHIRKKYNLDDICNSTEEITDIYELIKEDELNIDLDDLNLYIKIDKNILEEIFNIYILILSIKKNILIHNYIYNKYYANINSNKNYIEKPYNFKL